MSNEVITEGSSVRVKENVINPKYGWGYHVNHESVGTVVSVDFLNAIVDFPLNSRWKALVSEMELADLDYSSINTKDE